MLGKPFTGLDRKKLRRWLTLFLLALLIPTIVLIQQSYSRLKWEAFHQHQLMADELSRRIDKQFSALINSEQLRPFTDYAFLNVAGETSANFFQRSPLSKYPVESPIVGIIGYFQVDSAGSLMTPLIPQLIESASSYGIADKELTDRLTLQDRIRFILSQNQLLQKTPGVFADDTTGKTDEVLSESDADFGEFQIVAEELAEAQFMAPGRIEPMSDSTVISAVQGQLAFDELKKSSADKKSKLKTRLGRVDELSLTRPYQQQQTMQRLMPEKEQRTVIPKQRLRIEKNVLPEATGINRDVSGYRGMYRKNETQRPPATASPSPSETRPLRISTFESEIDPFEFSRLGTEYFMLYRKVWRNDQRYIQGLIIEQRVFLDNIINTAFRATALSLMSDLLVIYQADVLQAFSARTARGYLSSARELNTDLLYQSRLSAPLSDMQLLFSITQLPVGPGGQVIIWLTMILLVVLCGGFYLMYRLGLEQILLLNQQQDFVSAVSHELKTPLTSIRMYGEMLREGWASEDRKKTYYNFIFDESERLSRLINNVLLMARLSRNKQQVELISVTVAELMDAVKSKVSTQIQAAKFELDIDCDKMAGQASIKVDADWFSQIMINLVDNAIKFSAKADKKIINLSCSRLSNGNIQFKVRDYGPGIADRQMKKIFKLFYRSENELTRETVGTGIGLALVHQMTLNMNGMIDVINRGPGAEFSVTFTPG